MTEYRRPPSHDCPPTTDNPADQPNPPSNGSTCPTIPQTTPPTLDPPARCDPDPYCKCPTKPNSSPTCLEELIAKHTADIANGEKAAKFKTELDELQKQAKDASQKYTRSTYDDLVKSWKEVDGAIALLLSRLVCIVPCWRCVIECYICPLLNELHYAEQWLYDDEKLYVDVHDLYDLQHWHTRDKQIKDRRLARIQAVLGAWTKPLPHETLANTIKANSDLAGAITGSMSTEQSKAIYEVFFRLVPRHLAIAPPKAIVETKIDKEFTDFCKCDQGDKDDCCGPDVGKQSLRRRLLGPLPYIIDPNDYFTLICCIVDKRLKPAKEAAWKAETDLAAVTGRITTFLGQLGPDWPKTFEAGAKGAMPKVIDCCDYEDRDSESRSQQSR